MTALQTSATHDPIASLWDVARRWLIDALDAYGPPAKIAALTWRATRRALKRRIKVLETIVLKLLLVEASRLAAVIAEARPRPPASRAAASTRAVAPLDLARPDTWRVRFALRIPPEAAPAPKPPTSGPRIRDLGPPRLVTEVFADLAARARVRQLAAARFLVDPTRDRAKAEQLARRVEALRRVLVNPAPYARYLRRKLTRLAERAYDAAMRIALKTPPQTQVNRVINARVEFEACKATLAASAPPDSS